MHEAIEKLFAEAEAHDGFPAISDQAWREARAGDREFVTIGRDPLSAVGIVGAGELDVLVRPADRGQGIGARLTAELITRAEGQPLKAWVHGEENLAAERLVRAHDFQSVRTLLRLELAGDALPADTPPALPEGVSLTTFDPENRHQAESLIEVNARAFASHPEQGAFSLTDLEQTMREPWFDAKDLLLAWEGDRLLAFSWIKTTTGDTCETELYVIGVDPTASGRGLGTVMLQHTFARMAEHSPERVTLYVEGDNDPALALYRRAGFQTVQTSRQWLRHVDT